MDNQTVYILVMGLAVVLGLVFTVIYYFARYYIKMDSDDQEVVAALKSKSASAKSVSLRDALYGTRQGFFGGIEKIFNKNNKFSNDDLDSIEEVLFTSDVGPHLAAQLFEKVAGKVNTGEIRNISHMQSFLRDELQSALKVNTEIDIWDIKSKPTVWMIVGVNGVGKTTTIGKLASQAKQRGLKVLVAAGDTYRAAADQQLDEWASRAGVEIFKNLNTKDPSAVAFGALEFAKANAFDLVIVDTAGRLHTQEHLMEELTKTKRVMQKILAEAPSEVILVVDGNSGQNAIQQGRQFNAAVQLSGIIVTKLDGTSKGGVVVGLVSELQVPVRFIGIGEGVDDLRLFQSKEFVESIL